MIFTHISNALYFHTGFTAQQTPEAVALGVLQSGTTGLLRRLRPDNYPAFAELFTSA